LLIINTRILNYEAWLMTYGMFGGTRHAYFPFDSAIKLVFFPDLYEFDDLRQVIVNKIYFYEG